MDLFGFLIKEGIYTLSAFHKVFLREVSPDLLNIIQPCLLNIRLRFNWSGLWPLSCRHRASRSAEEVFSSTAWETAALRIPYSTLFGDHCLENHLRMIKVTRLNKNRLFSKPPTIFPIPLLPEKNKKCIWNK